MSASSLIEKDLRYIWHPCSQMKDYETLKPLEVIGANGCYITLANGNKLIDANSSWWCKLLGHQHPRLKAAIKKQMERFEHVALTNLTNATIVTLSEKLAQLTSNLDKVFYASDGACAIEIAMKMSLHSRKIAGDKKRTQFMALENGYHGETIGALSVSDIGIYRDPYRSMLIDTNFLSPLPYVLNTQDPLWQDSQFYWERIEKKLAPFSETLTAILVEPIVQGAGGMKIYAQDFLKRLRAWTKQHHIHLIADEIMTGMGRTGKMLACQHADIEPDFLCLSKSLTGGWLPLSAVLTHQSIYDLFYDDYKKGKSFLHSHTYSGNALAASVAIEVLNLIEEENVVEKANQVGQTMYENMLTIADDTKKLSHVRSIGAMVAADLICYPRERVGFEIYKKAIALGAFMRPLGNTIYWLPPLSMDVDTLTKLKIITEQAIQSVLF